MRNLMIWTAVLALTLLGSAGIAADNNTFPANGKVGIGTTSPVQKLDVVANSVNDGVNYGVNSRISGAAVWTTSAGYFNNTDTGSGNGIGIFVGGTDFGVFSNNGVNYFADKVGIRTTNPAAELDVNGDIIADNINALDVSVVDKVGIGIISPVQKLDVVADSVNDGVNYGVSSFISGAAPWITSAGFFNNTDTGSGDGVGIFVGGTDFGVFSNNGVNYLADKVGIGTTNPAAKLDVNGDIIADNINALDVSVVINGKSVSVAGLLAQIGTLQTQINALEDAIKDLPPGLRNIDRNGDGK